MRGNGRGTGRREEGRIGRVCGIRLGIRIWRRRGEMWLGRVWSCFDWGVKNVR